jgi:hypothetical protein
MPSYEGRASFIATLDTGAMHSTHNLPRRCGPPNRFSLLIHHPAASFAGMQQHWHRRTRTMACGMALLTMAPIAPARAQTPADLLPQIPPELLRELAKPDAGLPGAPPPVQTAQPAPCHGNLPLVNGQTVCDGGPAPGKACARLPRVNGQPACGLQPE